MSDPIQSYEEFDRLRAIEAGARRVFAALTRWPCVTCGGSSPEYADNHATQCSLLHLGVLLGVTRGKMPADANKKRTLTDG